MENRKPQNVTWPRPCGHVCSLQFTFERQEGLLAVSDLRQSFLPPKMVQPAFKGTNYLLYPFAMCLLDSNQWIIPVVWAIKVMHFDLMENDIMAALNNKRVVQIDFIFLSAVLT